MARTAQLYNVVAVAPSGATKVVASEVGALKASRLAAAVKAKGFEVKVDPVETVHVKATVVLGLRD